MRKPAPIFFIAAFVFACGSVLAQAAPQDTTGGSTQDAVRPQSAYPVAARHPQRVHYFSLEHRTREEMSAEDRDLLQSHGRGISIGAEIYGYDLTQGNWTIDQAICPAFPDTLMVHYIDRYPDGSESLFTALVPRGRGRVRVVPALHRNAANYLPAVKDPGNYALFNGLVPADIAKRDVSPEGKWLILGVCYAEMVGARPNVPDDPGLDIAMLRAPVSTFRVDTVNKTREVQFPDREGQNVFTVWTVTLSRSGHITGAMDEDYATYVARIVKLQEPTGTMTPNPAAAAGKITTPTEQPKITITNPPEIPQM